MRIIPLAASAAMLSTLLSAQSAAPARSSGYLTGAAIPDLTLVLPTAPAPGSPRDTEDRAIFKATRSLQDSARWKLAQNDDKLSVAALLADFQCALGLEATSENAKTLAVLVGRVSTDAGGATGPAKEHFQRKRPFVVDPGPTCIPITPAFEKSFDFPSGHTTISWALGLILAELVPDHAAAILTRARAFGESRIVCGVHNASAVEAGRVAGASIVAALHSSESFRTDFEKAKHEIAALRKNPASSECDAEMKLIATSPY
jgi:acid phosphatase (class A)